MRFTDKTKKAMEEIPELAQTVAELPEDEAKKIIQDIEGDEK